MLLTITFTEIYNKSYRKEVLSMDKEEIKPVVLINDLAEEQRQDIEKGLYSLQDLNAYINYLISQ